MIHLVLLRLVGDKRVEGEGVNILEIGKSWLGFLFCSLLVV